MYVITFLSSFLITVLCSISAAPPSPLRRAPVAAAAPSVLTVRRPGRYDVPGPLAWLRCPPAPFRLHVLPADAPHEGRRPRHVTAGLRLLRLLLACGRGGAKVIAPHEDCRDLPSSSFRWATQQQS